LFILGKYIKDLQIYTNQYSGGATAVCIYDCCLCAAGYLNMRQRSSGSYHLFYCTLY